MGRNLERNVDLLLHPSSSLTTHPVKLTSIQPLSQKLTLLFSLVSITCYFLYEYFVSLIDRCLHVEKLNDLRYGSAKRFLYSRSEAWLFSSMIVDADVKL